MTRKEFLKSLLYSIFGVISFSVDDNKIIKGGNNSMFHNCNYTVKSYNDFRCLFEKVFIDDTSEGTDISKLDCNRNDITARAKEYLSNHGISIPNHLTEKEQRQLIFDILANDILKTIIIDFEGKNKKEAESVEITGTFFVKIQSIQRDIVLNYAHKSDNICNGDTLFTDTDFESDPNKCNIQIRYNLNTDFDNYKEEKRILQYLRQIELVIPDTINKEGYESIDNLHKLILSGKFSSKQRHLQTYKYYPSCFFSDIKVFNNRFSFIFNTRISEDAIIRETKSFGLNSKINNYLSALYNKGHNQIESRIISELKPLYENNRTYLERIIKDLVFYSSQNKKLLEEYKKTGDEKVVKGILFDRCSQLFWNFEMPYLAIEQAYHDDVSRGMYIIIQNFILDLTEILISHGEEIAEQFKNNLSAKSFRNHKTYIQRYSDPVDKRFDSAFEFESVFAEKHKEYAKEPESIEEFFHCMRIGTYSSFRSALYEYYLKLQDAQKKKS